jgi:hypothetical protein
MLLIVLSGLVGAGVMFFILWPYGALVACFGAPFGGGIFAGLAALWLGRRAAARSSRSAERSRGETVNAESPAARMKVNPPPE